MIQNIKRLKLVKKSVALINILFLSFITMPSFAQNDFNLPSNIQQSRLIKTGQGELRRFGFHIYDAKLWRPESQLTTPYALQIKYYRNIKSSEIVDASIKEMNKQGVSQTVTKKWKKQLTSIIPNVKKGDVITGYNQGKQSTFYLNGKSIGTVNNAEFGQDFFGIWLKPSTSEPKLRQQLLN